MISTSLFNSIGLSGNRQKSFNDLAGYTLLELSVAVFITFLVSVLVIKAYVFAMRWISVWRHAVVIENNLHLVMQRISTDFMYAESIYMQGDSTWEITTRVDHTTYYTFTQKQLYRNDILMHDKSLDMLDFEVRPSMDQRLFALLPNEGILEEQRHPMQATIKLKLGGRHHTKTVITTVTCRQLRPWRPLPDI